MTLISSLYIGAAGLAANSLELAVVGDNIANANTIGFKGGRAAFEDVLGQSLLGKGELGAGARLQTVQKILAQGSITTTGVATDLAIQGPGLFIVQGPQGPLYTRAGQFTLNDDGLLVNLDGLLVQGFPASATGAIGGPLGSLQLADATAPPQVTTAAVIRANLDSEAAILGLPFDPADPAATSNFSTSITVFDSLGSAHQVDVHFNKTADGQWEWHAVTDGGNVDGGTPGVPQEIGGGTMTFDGSGNLVDATGTSITFDPMGAAPAQTVELNLGDPTSTGGTGAAGVTQFAGESVASFLSQDGFAAGTLAGVKIDDNGNVIGSFTNGQTRTLGQVALAEFPAPDQLERVGGNMFRAAPGSGEPNIGGPGTGERGSIVAGALEQSNVDLAGELVRMIVVQRAFQANSKTLTTADSLLAELIQIKR